MKPYSHPISLSFRGGNQAKYWQERKEKAKNMKKYREQWIKSGQVKEYNYGEVMAIIGREISPGRIFFGYSRPLQDKILKAISTLWHYKEEIKTSYDFINDSQKSVNQYFKVLRDLMQLVEKNRNPSPEMKELIVNLTSKCHGNMVHPRRHNKRGLYRPNHSRRPSPTTDRKSNRKYIPRHRRIHH